MKGRTRTVLIVNAEYFVMQQYVQRDVYRFYIKKREEILKVLNEERSKPTFEKNRKEINRLFSKYMSTQYFIMRTRKTIHYYQQLLNEINYGNHHSPTYYFVTPTYQELLAA